MLLVSTVAHLIRPQVKIQQVDKEAIATNQDHLIQMSSTYPSMVKEDLEEALVVAWAVVALMVLMGLEASEEVSAQALVAEVAKELEASAQPAVAKAKTYENISSLIKAAFCGI